VLRNLLFNLGTHVVHEEKGLRESPFVRGKHFVKTLLHPGRQSHRAADRPSLRQNEVGGSCFCLQATVPRAASNLTKL
jgi:hypothetical protein